MGHLTFGCVKSPHMPEGGEWGNTLIGALHQTKGLLSNISYGSNQTNHKEVATYFIELHFSGAKKQAT